jgi:hypothetical protein
VGRLTDDRERRTPMAQRLTFNRIAPGWQATPDGKWGVLSEVVFTDGTDGKWATSETEWAAVFDPHGRLRTENNAGDNLAWFDTAREAKAFLQAEAARRES